MHIQEVYKAKKKTAKWKLRKREWRKIQAMALTAKTQRI